MKAYHIVCHDCTEEAMLYDRTKAERRCSEHTRSTNHNMSMARVNRERT